MSNLVFTDIAWEDYLYWQMTDKKIVRKINELLADDGNICIYSLKGHYDD